MTPIVQMFLGFALSGMLLYIAAMCFEEVEEE